MSKISRGLSFCFDVTSDLTSSQYRMGHDACSAAASVEALPHGHRSHHWITDRFPGKNPIKFNNQHFQTYQASSATNHEEPHCIHGLCHKMTALNRDCPFKMAGHSFPCLKLADFCTVWTDQTYLLMVLILFYQSIKPVVEVAGKSHFFFIPVFPHLNNRNTPKELYHAAAPLQPRYRND